MQIVSQMDPSYSTETFVCYMACFNLHIFAAPVKNLMPSN